MLGTVLFPLYEMILVYFLLSLILPTYVPSLDQNSQGNKTFSVFVLFVNHDLY